MPIELVRGHLDGLLLAVLAEGPGHGYELSRRLTERSGGELGAQEGSLYPALHRLEHKGWLKAEWKMSEANRRAKYYSLTQSGKKQLLAEQSKWNELVETIGRVMKPA